MMPIVSWVRLSSPEETRRLPSRTEYRRVHQCATARPKSSAARPPISGPGAFQTPTAMAGIRDLMLRPGLISR